MSEDNVDNTETPTETVTTPAAPKTGKRGRVLKIVGALAVVLVIVGAIGALYVSRTSEARANRIYPVHDVMIVITEDPAQMVIEGERLSRARGCSDCHGANLAGRTFLEDPALGTFVASNLTGGEGSRVGEWSDGDIARVIRNGVNPDGTPAIFMPAHEYYAMPDREVGAIIAYIRSVAPVANDPGESRLGPIGRLLHVGGAMPIYPAELIDHEAPRPPDVVPSDLEAFGGYLADGCTGCHGATLSGGKIPGTPGSIPIPSNLTPHETGLAPWTLEEFDAALRQGIGRDGRELDPFMPSANYASLTDHEVEALWTYLQSVPATEFGER